MFPKAVEQQLSLTSAEVQSLARLQASSKRSEKKLASAPAAGDRLRLGVHHAVAKPAPRRRSGPNPNSRQSRCLPTTSSHRQERVSPVPHDSIAPTIGIDVSKDSFDAVV